MVNVWVKEANLEQDEYCLVEKQSRKSAIESLYETILDGNGAVPSWVLSVKFFEDGDIPTEIYRAGDVIARSNL